MSEKRKKSIYLPPAILEELQEEVVRQERPISWLLQQAWKVAKPTIKSLPTIRDHRPVLDDQASDEERSEKAKEKIQSA